MYKKFFIGVLCVVAVAFGAIFATADAPSGMTVLTSLFVGDPSDDPDVTPGDDDLYVKGTLEADGATRIDGSIDANSTMNVSGAVTFQSTVSAEDLASTDDASVADNLTVSGKTSTGSFVFGTASYAFGTSDAQDAVDVTDLGVIFLDSSSYAITLGGFTNGVSGQVLHLTVTDASNTITIEHNEGGGNQDMQLDGAGDVTLNVNEGTSLICDGTDWYEVHR